MVPGALLQFTAYVPAHTFTFRLPVVLIGIVFTINEKFCEYDVAPHVTVTVKG